MSFLDSISDFFSSSYNQAKQWAGSVSETIKQYYDTAQEWIDKGEQYIADKYDEFLRLNQEMADNDALIQKSIDEMSEGDDKERLLQKFNDNRSYYSKYLAPMINSMNPDDYKIQESYGIVPFVAIGFSLVSVALLVGVISYCYVYLNNQSEIMKDPSLKKIMLKNVAETKGAFAYMSTIASDFKWPLIIGGVALTFFGASKVLRK